MQVVSVNVGLPRQVETPYGIVLTGIFKSPVAGRVAVRRHNIAGDRQADLSVHGGPNKAVYAYSSEHYPYWAQQLPDTDLPFGKFGENLTLTGLTEEQAHIGAHYRIGTSVLRVTQPRMPCFKLALRFNDKHMLKAMIRSGRSGWYYRVLQEGTIEPGNPVELVERPNPNFPFARLVELISFGKVTTAELEQMQNMPGLALNWRQRAREMLQRPSSL